MRQLDLDLLRALVAVADAGSLSAAAPRLCRSQSAVSEQIRKLEEICGVELLRRGRGGARATPAGLRLLDHARKLLSLHDVALDDMRGVALAGDLRMAITDYFRPKAIADILKRVRAHYPRLRLHVSVRKSAEIEGEASDGAFDIGLSMRILDGRSEGLDGRIRLGVEKLAWVAARDAAPPNGLLPLVALPQSCGLQRFVTRLLDASAVDYYIAHSASGIAGLQSALLAGLGIACLNTSAVPEGVVRLDAALPVLPEVEFALTPPLAGEAAIVADVRDMLTAQLRDFRS